MSGGLVGLVLGNATIKNLAVIYEDASFISQDEGGGYGVFGYVTNGAPVIDNCYIERINTVNSRSSVLGIMARPNGRLVLKNTVVYGYNVQNNCSWWGEEVNCISKDSVNAYAIHNRANTATQTMLRNFTKVFDDGIWEGSREVLLSEIADARGFNDAYWHKENGKLIWKGIEIATINWVTEEETITEVVTKGGYFVPQGLPESSESATEIITYHWATSQNGSAVGMGTSIQGVDDATYYLVKNVTKKTVKITWVINGEESYTEHELGEALNPEAPTVESDIYVYEFLGWSLSEDGDIVEIGEVTEAKTYYAVFDKQLKGETEVSAIADILYSSHDDQLFLPAGIDFTISTVTAITSGDGATVYYQDGAWVRNFDLSAEQIRSNSIGTTEVLITTNDNVKYSANVKSYAGVIDELADFPRFFNNTAVPSEFDATKTAVAPNVYGYYIVTKNLGTASYELALTQTEATDYNAANGFNGVLDGQGYKLQFNLTSGGLVGMIMGNATVKNLAIQFSDNTSGHYGVFGYRVGGNTVIENCYIERTNNTSTRTSVYGIVACTNKKLDLKNTVVHGGQFSNAADWYSNMHISTNSTNAFLIYARLDKNAQTWVIAQNFTEIVDGGVLTSDLSSFDTNYWNTASNRISWKDATDTAFSAVTTVNVG